MSWVRLDDGLCMHPKVLRLQASGNVAALALWTLALSRAGQRGTDGVVDRDYAALMFRDELEQMAAALVEVGLWKVCGDTWRIHDFADYNADAKSRAELSEKRRAAGRKGGQAKARRQAGDKPVALASRGAGAGQGVACSPVPVPDPVPDPESSSSARPPGCDVIEDGLTALGLTVPAADLDSLLAEYPHRDPHDVAARLARWQHRNPIDHAVGALRHVLGEMPELPPTAQRYPSGPGDAEAVQRAVRRLRESHAMWWDEHRVVGRNGAGALVVEARAADHPRRAGVDEFREALGCPVVLQSPRLAAAKASRTPATGAPSRAAGTAAEFDFLERLHAEATTEEDTP